MYAAAHRLSYTNLLVVLCLSLYFGCAPKSVIARGITAEITEEITPAHNYQQASDIISGLRVLRQQQHITTVTKAISRDSNITPTDVYNNSYQLLEKLSQLASKPADKSLSKIKLPVKKSGRMIPADSEPLLQQAKNITNTLLSNYQYQYQPVPALYSPGMTPPDVDMLVRKAIMLTDSLL